MLNLVRKHADSWLIKTILWLIVFAFVGTIFYSWGMGGATRLTGDVIATVEGENIHQGEYNQTFDSLVNFYRDQFKSQFSEELVRRLDLKNAAMDALIQKKLLLQEAEKQGIRVSDEELADRIKSFPSFQKDKKFSKTLYRNFLRFRRLTPMEFEEGQRESLIIDKVEQMIRQNVKVSNAEVLDTFKKEEEKIKLDYLVIPEDFFPDKSPVTEEEKKEFYEKNKSGFEVPEKIKVEYVQLTAKDFEAEIQPTEEEIKNYYDMKIADFQVKKRYHAHHILHRIDLPPADENASEEEKQKRIKAAEETAKAKAEATLKRIREGAKFEDVAKEVSDDEASGAQGGDLGQFSQGTMVSEFEAALNGLKPGEISEPVLTPFGFHIIRLDEVKEEHTKPLSEVKEAIIQSIKTMKSRQRMRREIKRLRQATAQNQDLATAAREKNLEVRTTAFFSEEDRNLPGIGAIPQFYTVAFGLKDNQVSVPINTPEASYLVKVVGREAAHIPPLSEVEEDLEKAVALKKSKTLTSRKVEEIAKTLSGDNDLKKVAEKNQLEMRNTPFFSMVDSIPGIGNIAELKEKAFAMKKGETAEVSARNNHYLIKLADRMEAQEPSEDQFREIYARLKKQKSDGVFQDWMKNLRERSEIMIDRTLL